MMKNKKRITIADLASNPGFISQLKILIRKNHTCKQIYNELNISKASYERLRREFPFIQEIVEESRRLSIKTCRMCGHSKDKRLFPVDKSKKDGLRNQCMECYKKYHSDNYARNKSKINLANKTWYQNNTESRRKSVAQYRSKNKKRFATMKKQRKSEDPIFSLKIRLRDRISHAFRAKGWEKGGGSELLIGADYETVKKHIEKQFSSGMSWDTLLKGEIHIDHIVPLASADCERDLMDLCHYTNLQPLWAIDNLRKGARVI